MLVALSIVSSFVLHGFVSVSSWVSQGMLDLMNDSVAVPANRFQIVDQMRPAVRTHICGDESAMVGATTACAAPIVSLTRRFDVFNAAHSTRAGSLGNNLSANHMPDLSPSHQNPLPIHSHYCHF